MALVPAFFQLWGHIVASLGRSHKEVAIFAVSYSLASRAKYPWQLIQAVDTLRYIQNHNQDSTRSVVLVGDSAGARLALGALLHLTHKHPAIEELRLTTPLEGVDLMSCPGTTNDKSLSKEVETYEGGDIIGRTVVEAWMKDYLGDAPPDYYTDPITAPDEWFENLQTRRMLLLSGGNESLFPMMEALGKKFKVSDSLRPCKLVMALTNDTRG